MSPVRVLIADPDRYLVASYRDRLWRHGLEVATATDGLECLDLLRRFEPDVLVLDPSLPWGGGDGVLTLMHEEADIPSIPVILITAHFDRSLLYHLSRFQVEGSYVKPLSASRLVETIVGLLEHRGTSAHLPSAAGASQGSGHTQSQSVR